MERIKEYESCTLCPRECGINRYENKGFCGTGASVIAAKSYLHKWEEPCISVTNGAGTIFFSGCSLRCRFCQNSVISSKVYGAEISTERLADIFLELQDKGADNIELVTPSHFAPSIIQALDKVRHRLSLPVIWNTGGYEMLSTLRLLEGYIDIWLPDLKYHSEVLSARYSSAPDYFNVASDAILEMARQAGTLRFAENGKLLKGTIIRHLVLPGGRHDSMKIMEWIAENIPSDKALVSIMNQYTPFDFIPDEYPELKRRVTKMEYNSVVRHAEEIGIKGYTQEKSSATDKYVPDFDLTGII